MFDIVTFIIDYSNNLSVPVLILSIVGAIFVCLYNYKTTWKEYLLNPRNTRYVAILILFTGLLFFLIENQYLVGLWVVINVGLWVCYLISVVHALKPRINYFSHPILKCYAEKLSEGEILDNLPFFEKDTHWFICEMDIKIEYRLLQAKYFASAQMFDKAYIILNSMDERYLYSEEILFIHRKKAFLLTQMGAMSAALLLLGKAEECDSKDPYVWIAFSYIYEQQGNIEKAMEYAVKARNLLEVLSLNHADVAQIYNDYGRIALMNGNKQETLYYYRRAYKLAKEVKDVRIYAILVSNLLIHMAIEGEQQEKCEELLYDFKNRIRNQSVDNLIEYNNCAITYYRQIKNEQAVFAIIQNGYKEVIGKLCHEQAECYKASTFRMIMNGTYIHDWFDEEIDSDFKNYEDLQPLTRLRILKEYMGIFSQLEFRSLLRIEKYRKLYSMITDYYYHSALDDIEDCLNEVDSANVYLYREILMMKLGILRFIQKERHVELSKQEYLNLFNTLYDAGLRIEATHVLQVFMDECASQYNILVKMPNWTAPMFYYEYIEQMGLPPEPQRHTDQIHMMYLVPCIPKDMQIIPTQEKYLNENIEMLMKEFDAWKSHPAKIEMSIFITHILVCLGRREEAERFYNYYKEAGISDLQFASWFRNQVKSLEMYFRTLGSDPIKKV